MQIDKSEQGDQGGQDQGQQAEGQSQTQDQLVDLDGLSSFNYQGKTYTPDQLHEIVQGYSKYGETSKYVEDDQKYWSNVSVDIDKVLQNPNLLGAFKQTYPERFHNLLDQAMSRTQQGQNSQTVRQESQQQGLPREVLERLQKVDGLEQRLHQADVAAASAKIDATLPPLLEKYNLADEDKVLIEAEKLLGKGQRLTDATWERLVKEDHQRTQKRADKFYEAKLKSQLGKGQKGSDIGAGGGTPGMAPVKPKTFAEAQEAMINHLKNK